MRSSPLNDLLRAGQTLKWTQKCQDAFEDMRAVLTGEEGMAYPKDDGLYILNTDASLTGTGTALSQMQWSEQTEKYVERPVAFASKSLTKVQRRYCVTRRELLAVVTFLQQFRNYLLGRQFVVRNDHRTLRWIMSFHGWRYCHSLI